MMVVAVGITSEEVRSLASQAPAVRAGRLASLKCLVVSGDAGLRGRLHTMSELGGFSSCEMPTEAVPAPRNIKWLLLRSLCLRRRCFLHRCLTADFIF